MTESQIKTARQRLEHEKEYVAFLERRLASKHYKASVSPEEYAGTEAKLKKAKLVMRMLSK
jgi:hypothetical protein